jgi:hypothetical protein
MAKKKLVNKRKYKKGNHESQTFYVGIEDAIPVRKSILEASKDMVQCLQQYDRFTAVRSEKHVLVGEVRKALRHCATEIGRLRKVLPYVAPAPKPKKVKESKKDPKQAELKKFEEKKLEHHDNLGLGKRETHELAKLEKELNEIESKLGEM